MGIPLFQVDAFSSRPFAGNPAAVCFPEAARPGAWLQEVAAEMNLSETAFLLPGEDGWGLRWFTPATEVDLCGHATLASAWVLWETGRLARTAGARFHTRSGLLTAELDGNWIRLDFPATPPEPCPEPPGLARALGAAPRGVWRSIFDYLVELESDDTIRRLAPDFAALARIETRGIIVTARSADSGFDFVSRFFAPRRRSPGGPGHRFRPLLPGTLLGRTPGQNRATGLSGLQARRSSQGGDAGCPRSTGWRGGDRLSRRAFRWLKHLTGEGQERTTAERLPNVGKPGSLPVSPVLAEDSAGPVPVAR